MLVAVDIICVINILIIAFVPGLSVSKRKFLFVASVFALSCILLYYLGLVGPGLIYLQTACIFSILIFPARYALWPAIVNTLTCVGFGIALTAGALPWNHEAGTTIGSWIAITSNLVFLNFLCAALLPRLFDGMQETIQKGKELQQALTLEQQAQIETMVMLEQKNIELEQFAYVASHDLQEPLRMVTSFLALLEKKYQNIVDDKGKQYINFALDGARRMRQMILDLLEFSRAGHLDDLLERVDLNEIVAEIRILYSRQIEESGTVLKVSQLPVVFAYKAPLRQVFQNLISNALKYRSELICPVVEISAQERALDWEFTVSDNGIGMSPDRSASVFILFKRLHCKDKYGGTGLGLALCKKIIENMGGTISVISEEGKGSKFLFTIKDNQPDQVLNGQ